MTAGSATSYTVTLAQADCVTPYPITGFTWSYIVRTSLTDTSGSPVIRLTTTPGAQGVLAVNVTAAVITVELAPAATAITAVTPGTYWHSLWANPGLTSQQNMYWGQFTIQAAPEP